METLSDKKTKSDVHATDAPDAGVSEDQQGVLEGLMVENERMTIESQKQQWKIQVLEINDIHYGY